MAKEILSRVKLIFAPLMLTSVLWLIPFIVPFDLPEHYKNPYFGKHIEVWELWFYFPVIAIIIVMTAYLSRRVDLNIRSMLVFVMALLAGQALGMALYMILEGQAIGIVNIIPILFFYTIFVVPVALGLYIISHVLFSRLIKH